VLRHPEFLGGKATTSFIERTPELFEFGGRHDQKASKLLNYLANMVSCSSSLEYQHGRKMEKGWQEGFPLHLWERKNKVPLWRSAGLGFRV